MKASTMNNAKSWAIAMLITLLLSLDLHHAVDRLLGVEVIEGEANGLQ